jgi:hypothetical protein
MTDALPVPPTWQDAVPLREVAEVGQASPVDLYNMIKRGFITPLPERGKYGAVLLSRDDAITLLVAIAAATLAGVALGSVVRLAASGVKLTLPT